jgi:hypothetical protein
MAMLICDIYQVATRENTPEEEEELMQDILVFCWQMWDENRRVRVRMQSVKEEKNH